MPVNDIDSYEKTCRNACTTAAIATSPTTTSNDRQWYFRVLAAMSGVSGLSVATAYAESPQKPPAASERATHENPLLLYQYEVCPWCNKVKAVLDFHDAPYKTVEVDPVFKSELKFSDYKKVPVLLTPDGEQLNDSKKIVEDIHAQYSSGKSGWCAFPHPGRFACAVSKQLVMQQWLMLALPLHD